MTKIEHINKGKKYNKDKNEQRKIVKYFTMSHNTNENLKAYSNRYMKSMAQIIEEALKFFFKHNK